MGSKKFDSALQSRWADTFFLLGMVGLCGRIFEGLNGGLIGSSASLFLFLGRKAEGKLSFVTSSYVSFFITSSMFTSPIP